MEVMGFENRRFNTMNEKIDGQPNCITLQLPEEGMATINIRIDRSAIRKATTLANGSI